jgi:hypothetical protein
MILIKKKKPDKQIYHLRASSWDSNIYRVDFKILYAELYQQYSSVTVTQHSVLCAA